MSVATIALESIKLRLVRRYELLDEDPNEKVEAWIVEMLQEVDLDAPPAVI
jgi:hypothetical protein